jgi:MFS family permease
VLSACFATGGIYSIFAKAFSPVLYVVFVIIGFAWAAINVNSLPMVVEMCSGSDIGKFTGLYYTFSMSAQIVTPILSGFFLEHVDTARFPVRCAFRRALVRDYALRQTRRLASRREADGYRRNFGR